MNAPVKIGLSLNPNYLAQHPDDIDRNWFGPPEAFLRELTAAGVTHIELRAVTPSTPIPTAEVALWKVWSAGLEATLHGTLPPPDENWTQTLAPLIHLLRLIAEHKPAAHCPITVHARAAATGDVTLLAQETIAILARTARWIAHENLPALLALEINRAKGKADPSTTYLAVRDMQQRADAAGAPVGICWDMGHTWSNVLTDGLSPEPPTEFLTAVRHTHIHDLGPSGKTHWPLTERRLPLDRFTSALAATGYQGVWNLELEPKRYAAEPNIRQRIIQSIHLLRSTVDAATLKNT